MIKIIFYNNKKTSLISQSFFRLSIDKSLTFSLKVFFFVLFFGLNATHSNTKIFFVLIIVFLYKTLTIIQKKKIGKM